MQNLANIDRGGQSDLDEYLTEAEVAALRETHWDILWQEITRVLWEEYPARLRRDRICDELDRVVRNQNYYARFWLNRAIDYRAERAGLRAAARGARTRSINFCDQTIKRAREARAAACVALALIRPNGNGASV
jgi:hypothetical protein